MPAEGSGTPGGGVVTGGGTGGGPGGDDASALWEYAHAGGGRFGANGDFTWYPGRWGYGRDNIGPLRPAESLQNEAVSLLNALATEPDQSLESPSQRAGDENLRRGPEPYSGVQISKGSMFAFAGDDIDVFSGTPLALKNPNPFTGFPSYDPFVNANWPQRAPLWAPFATFRQSSLLSSRGLLADNDVTACIPSRTSCMPEVKSDFSESSLANFLQAEMDQSNAAMQALQEGKAKIIPDSEYDITNLVSNAAQVAGSDERKLAYTVNQLRDHPLEVRHSSVVAGLGHMAKGGVLMVGSGLIIYGTGGLALPLIGATGFGAGAAQSLSGLTLAFSGADSTETVRMNGQLDYVFALTKSPTSLAFGTTGLVLSHGDLDVSERFALVGGIAEDLSTFRGDPSKLYSAVIPGIGTKVEKGASMLLVKDVTALGFTARAANIETVATKLTRDFTVDDLKAISAFREEMARSGRLDLAGVAGHVASGASGSGAGVDFIRYGAFTQELKLHGPYTGIQQFFLDKASTQSLNYSIKFQLETRALGEQLVQIRSVKHIWISPTEAVKFVE